MESGQFQFVEKGNHIMQKRPYSELNRIRKLAGCKLLEASIDRNELGDNIISLFSEKKPTDFDVHSLAKKLSVSPDVVEDEIYNLLFSFLKKLGKHKTVPDDKFDPKELEMGRKVEREHTDHEWIAELIAKDHLTEFPDYYTRLKAMEAEGEKEKSKS